MSALEPKGIISGTLGPANFLFMGKILKSFKISCFFLHISIMKKIFHDILGLDNRIKISQLNISIFFPVTAKLKKKSKKN